MPAPPLSVCSVTGHGCSKRVVISWLDLLCGVRLPSPLSHRLLEISSLMRLLAGNNCPMHGERASASSCGAGRSRGPYSGVVGTVSALAGFWSFLVGCLFCAALQREPAPLLPGHVYSTKSTVGNLLVWLEGWRGEGIS